MNLTEKNYSLNYITLTINKFNSLKREKLVNKKGCSHKNNIDNFIFGLSICFLLYCITCVLSETFSITMWRHDAIIHRDDDYTVNLIKEGRWLNYLIYPFLKQINPHLSTVVCLACLCFFGYKCAISLTSNKRISCLYSLSILLIPNFYSFVGWPLVGLPAYILLAWAAYAYDKFSIYFVLGTSIVFLFGTQNNLCNLVPLLYLSKTKKLKGTINLITLWIVFYLAGYIVTLLMVRKFGHIWGLQIAEWRHPNVMASFDDVITNIKVSYHCLKNHVHLFGHRIIFFILIFILYRIIVGLKRSSNRNVNIYTVLLVLCIGISCYVQALPMGLHVYDRSAHPLWIALISIGLITFFYSKNIAVLFIVIVAYSNFFLSYGTIHFYATVGNVWTDYVNKIHVDPRTTNNVYLCMTDQDVSLSVKKIVNNNKLNNYMTEGLGAVYRLAPAFKDQGFKNIKMDHQNCKLLEANNSNNIFSYNYKDKDLFVWFNK